MAKPITHRCRKCGYVIDPKTATTITMQSHSPERVTHFYSGREYTRVRSRNVMPTIKLCESCASVAKDVLEAWMESE